LYEDLNELQGGAADVAVGCFALEYTLVKLACNVHQGEVATHNLFADVVHYIV
jgi:hypothetical protein